MSNFLGIATVTATLSQLIRAAAVHDVPAANVTTVRPDRLTGTAAAGPGVNIFLYQVSSNGAYRNEDLPSRASDGQRMLRPKAAINLHFLVSVFGDDGQLEPQRLLGIVARTLEGRPVLTRAMIRATITDPAFGYLAGSDLADDVELVKFSPIPLSLEELSKLWSVFFQTPYVLSVAYEGSVVLVDGTDPSKATLPVRARNAYVVPVDRPSIESLASATGPAETFSKGDVLVVQGTNLRGNITLVRLHGKDAPADEIGASRVAIRLTEPPFPAGTIRAGLLAVQVVHKLAMGSPEKPHPGFESNVAAFILRPTIVGAPSSASPTDVSVRVDPIVGRTQKVNLLLTEMADDNPASYVFASPTRLADSNQISFVTSGVKAGRYLVRVQIDGAENQLQVDTTESSPTQNKYVGPWVDL